jgi:hypothetical protein
MEASAGQCALLAGRSGPEPAEYGEQECEGLRVTVSTDSAFSFLNVDCEVGGSLSLNFKTVTYLVAVILCSGACCVFGTFCYPLEMALMSGFCSVGYWSSIQEPWPTLWECLQRSLRCYSPRQSLRAKLESSTL